MCYFWILKAFHEAGQSVAVPASCRLPGLGAVLWLGG